MDTLDPAGDGFGFGYINSKTGITAQSFTTQFKQDPMVFKSTHDTAPS
jgi:hypothetical protein